MPTAPTGREPDVIVSVAQMRALEAAAVAAGTPEQVLQERAGLAVADVIEQHVQQRSRAGWKPSILALVGSGNNGRDAAVAARRLAWRGCRVEIRYGSRCPLSEAELRDLTAEGVAAAPFGDRDSLAAAIDSADYLIDGLLGVGARGPMRPDLNWVPPLITRTQTVRRRPWVVAVDVPSGIDADTGSVPGESIRADVTVTFGAVKAGLLRFPAANYVGRLVAAPIGIPAEAISHSQVNLLTPDAGPSLVLRRPLDSHKYSVGRVLVVAGSDQYVGAACLCSEAAARVGAGLVGVVSTEAVKRVLATRFPEATYPLTLTNLEEQPEASAERIAEILPEQRVLLIGPGIGRSAGTARFLRRLLSLNGNRQVPVPAVIDADALSLLALWDHWREKIGTGNVLTPHAGEMARLLGGEMDKSTAPWEIAREAAQRWQQTVVLKGPFTTIAEPSGCAWVWPHANPALATAGTGDVLAGVIAGLLAQEEPRYVEPQDPALLGVVVHALAARRVLEKNHWRTLLASDLLLEIPAVLASLAERP